MSKNISILIIIAALVLVALGFYFLFGRNDTQMIPDTQPIAQEEEDGVNDTSDVSTLPGNTTDDAGTSAEPAAVNIAVVTYTSEGFSPRVITVSEGQTVRFVNESGGSMWVASAVHPTHQIFPAFDQLGIGDAYEFTFTQIGEWKYHNHVRASDTGTVIAAE